MTMKTTLGEIKRRKPCSDGYKILCEGLGTTDPDTVVTLSQILDINGVQDAYWSLRCWDYRDVAPLLADVVESVLPIFEDAHPEDDRVRVCVATIRKYARGECSVDELSKSAAYDNAAAAYNAAAYAAYNAAAYAAYSAGAAANAAAAAANAAAGSAAGHQWQINEKLLREFIAQQEEDQQ